MKAWLAAIFAMFIVMLPGETLIAQGIAVEPEFRKWDVAGTLGLFGSNRRYFERTDSYYGDPVTVAGNLDVGRYLTTHVKADFSVMTTQSRNVYDPGVYSDQVYSYSLVKARPTTVAGAVTYQFFENVFAHPYVSAGLALTSIHEERTVYSLIPPSLINQTTAVSHDRPFQLSPLVAAGYKSYFNERAFMKSELLFAALPDRFSYATLRIGFGIDF